MLDQITPVLLTFNEAENIGRTISRLTWATDIVVVDSGSTDETLSILSGFVQVRVVARPFDTLGNQWRYAINETGIKTPWILRLDADYQLSDELISEISLLDPHAALSAYRIAFDYAVFSKKLGASLYPPNTVLVRREKVLVRDEGHTERWDVQGPVGTIRARIAHDDWKQPDRFVETQIRYMRRELAALNAGRGGYVAWLRMRPPLMPLIAFLYCLFGKGLIFNGRAGIFYALQRLVAEAILSLMVLDGKLRNRR